MPGGSFLRARVASVEMREATEQDWPLIWPIFREVVRAGDTYAFDPDLTPDQARDLWLEQPPGRTVVAVIDERVVGTAKMGPNRPGPGSHVGTASFMVAADARGLGVGRALAEESVAWHRQQGFHGIQFDAVVETNTAAVRSVAGPGLPDRRHHPRGIPRTRSTAWSVSTHVAAARRAGGVGTLHASPTPAPAALRCPVGATAVPVRTAPRRSGVGREGHAGRGVAAVAERVLREVLLVHVLGVVVGRRPA